jgi:phosphomannomutase
MLPILALLTGAADAGLTLSAFAARLPTRATASDRLPEIPQELSAPLLRSLASDPATRSALLDGIGETAGIDLTDGVRMTLATGDIVHLRMSGNAPELRCYAEAADAHRAQGLVAKVLARVAEHLQPDP